VLLLLLLLVVDVTPTSRWQRAEARWGMRRRAVGSARGPEGAVRATSRPVAAGPGTCSRRVACAGTVRGLRSPAATSRATPAWWPRASSLALGGTSDRAGARSTCQGVSARSW